jgi:hypothetical protein
MSREDSYNDLLDKYIERPIDRNAITLKRTLIPIRDYKQTYLRLVIIREINILKLRKREKLSTQFSNYLKQCDTECMLPHHFIITVLVYAILMAQIILLFIYYYRKSHGTIWNYHMILPFLTPAMFMCIAVPVYIVFYHNAILTVQKHEYVPCTWRRFITSILEFVMCTFLVSPVIMTILNLGVLIQKVNPDQTQKSVIPWTIALMPWMQIGITLLVKYIKLIVYSFFNDGFRRCLKYLNMRRKAFATTGLLFILPISLLLSLMFMGISLDRNAIGIGWMFVPLIVCETIAFFSLVIRFGNLILSNLHAFCLVMFPVVCALSHIPFYYGIHWGLLAIIVPLTDLLVIVGATIIQYQKYPLTHHLYNLL